MNDSKEFSHAIDLASLAIHAYMERCTGERSKALCSALDDLLKRIYSMSLYVCCFSEVGDSLSQWRGYCPPNFGYCLGFDADKLSVIAARQGFTLKACVYDRPVQEAQISAWVECTLSALQAILPATGDIQSFCDSNMGMYLHDFRQIAPYMKDPAFKDEKEWRLVGFVHNIELIKLRPGKTLLVPYVPISLEMTRTLSPLWDVKIGPTPHRELAMSSASNLFHKVYIQNGISNTTIPYRDW
jgi:hypothetical protein